MDDTVEADELATKLLDYLEEILPKGDRYIPIGKLALKKALMIYESEENDEW